MAGQYRNLMVKWEGRDYRVAFYTPTMRPMLVARQGVRSEYALTLTGRRAMRIIEAALDQMVAGHPIVDGRSNRWAMQLNRRDIMLTGIAVGSWQGAGRVGEIVAWDADSATYRQEGGGVFLRGVVLRRVLEGGKLAELIFNGPRPSTA